jgi:hypothetical protein
MGLGKAALLFLLAASMVMVTVGASSPPVNRATLTTLKNFIAAYVPGQIITSSVFINESVGGYNYTIMQLNGTGDNYIVFNATNLTINNRSFVLDLPTNFKVLTPYLVKKYYPSSNAIANLTNTLKNYQKAAQPPLSDCLHLTGLDSYTCPTSVNYTTCVQSTCQGVPVCAEVLAGVGTQSPFARGIYNFSLAYSSLNSSYASYYALAASLAPQTISTVLPQLSSIATNISTISSVLVQNPIFPTPINITAQAQQICPNYMSGGGPWYCYALGFCELTSFNATMLSNLQAQINALQSLPLTNATIENIAIQASNNGASYFEPKYIEQQSTIYNITLGPVILTYNSLLTNMSFLSLRYQNASMQASIAALQGTYASISSKGINQNYTTAKKTLQSAITNSIATYNKVKSKYVPLYMSAYNNTSLILLRELDYKVPPSYVSVLAQQQASINQQLNGMITANVAASLSSKESSINSQAMTLLPPFSIAASIKAVDGGILDSLLSSPTTPIATKIATAPLYAALISFIIGVVILAVIYLATYFRLSRKHRLNTNPTVRRAWSFLFILLFVIVLIYTYTTYAYAQGANNFLPVSGFTAASSQSNTIYIMVNQSIASSSSYTSVQQCVSALEKTLQHYGKTAYNGTFSGSSCTLPSNTAITGVSCFNYLFANGKPTIIIDQGSNSTITYSGLYGYSLYATGTAAQGNACALNAVAQVV